MDLVAKANTNLLQNLDPFLQTPQVKHKAPHHPMLYGDDIVIVIVIVEMAKQAMKLVKVRQIIVLDKVASSNLATYDVT